MKVIPTELPEVLLIEPKVFGDARGFFMESWNRKTFASLGLDLDFVQDNHSRSGKGVLRGLHYQLRQPQGKLVRVTSGAVYDVAVDLRKSSPRFGKWTGHELSAENKHMLWLKFVIESDAKQSRRVTSSTSFGSPRRSAPRDDGIDQSLLEHGLSWLYGAGLSLLPRASPSRKKRDTPL